MQNVKHVSDRWFNKYSVQVEYRDENGEALVFPAIIQPLRYKNKMYLSGVRMKLGFEGRKKFLMLFPASANLTNATSDSSMLLYDGYRYVFDRVENVYLADKVVYNWAIIQKGATFNE